jgi:hypothetical protein
VLSSVGASGGPCATLALEIGSAPAPTAVNNINKPLVVRVRSARSALVGMYSSCAWSLLISVFRFFSFLFFSFRFFLFSF